MRACVRACVRACAGENDNAIRDTKPLMLRSSIMSKEENFSANAWYIRGFFS